jgi:glycerol dehydrogenase-like iron-containing ADH family enzyme
MAGCVNQPQPENAIVAAGIKGPLLLVATGETVARYAPAWAANCESNRGGYRVLVIRTDDAGEAEQIIVEARSLAAAGLIALGDEPVIAAATAAAAQLGLPIVTIPVGPLRD